MPATPADIAQFTVDGVVITSPTDPSVSAGIAGAFIDARTGAATEIEMFYDNASDGQTVLDERFSYLAQTNPSHLGIEVEEALDIGGSISITPAVPRFRVVDASHNQDEPLRTRAYAYDMGTDRFSVEVLK
jgi:hypothetical protein